MILRICFVLSLLTCALTASAQFSDSVHYHAAYSGTGVLNNTADGNSYVLNNGLRLNMKHRRLESHAAVSWLYGAQQRKVTNNDLGASLDFNRYLRIPHAYYWGLGTFEKSLSLKVANRTQAGLGLAYNIIDRRDSLFVNISDGIIYEYSNLIVNDTVNEVYSTVRNSLRLRVRFRLMQYLIAEGTGYWQPSLLDGSDYIVRANAGISLKLNRWLALTTALTYNKISRTNRENLLLTFGLSMERWF